MFHSFNDNFVSDFHSVSLFGWVMNIVYHTFRAVALYVSLLFACSCSTSRFDMIVKSGKSRSSPSISIGGS